MIDVNDFEQETCDYDGNKEEQPKEDEKKRSRYEGMPLLTIVQIALCTLILCGAFILKFLGGDIFIRARGWYLDHLNDPIIAGESLNDKGNFSGKNVKNVGFDAEKERNVPEVSIPMFKPLNEGKLTSGFGLREDPFTGEEKIHRGIDIGGEKGSPIYSVFSGKVEKAGSGSSYGKYIVLDHGNNIKTLYAHCDSLKVKEGQNVKRGEEIAFLGSTGKATGNHLHFEINVNGIRYNPEPFFKNFYI